jgi:hypothetical protein
MARTLLVVRLAAYTRPACFRPAAKPIVIVDPYALGSGPERGPTGSVPKWKS